MQTAKIHRPDGAIISCDAQGDAALPPLLLSNSLATPRALWDDMLPELLKEFRVIRYDTRGHGESQTPNGNATLGDLANDAVAVLDEFKVARALMVGISLGGMTALEMAVHHGDRLTGIVACNCRDFVDDAGKAAWEERIGITQKGGMTAIASGTIARWFTDDFRLSNPDLMQRVADMINATQPLGFEACARAIMTMTLQSKIDAISIPAHFVAGSDDGAASSDVMNAMAKRVSGAACTTLADCGHLSSLNRGPELLHEIRTFATHISN